MIPIVDTCDAIAAALEPHMPVTGHHTWKYAEPTFLTPDTAPLLVVAPRRDTFEAYATTGEHALTRTIGIHWIVDASFGAVAGGIGIPQLAAVEAARIDQLIDEITSWAEQLPGAPAGITAMLRGADYRGVADGLLWRTELIVDVEDIG